MLSTCFFSAAYDTTFLSVKTVIVSFLYEHCCCLHLKRTSGKQYLRGLL